MKAHGLKIGRCQFHDYLNLAASVHFVSMLLSKRPSVSPFLTFIGGVETAGNFVRPWNQYMSLVIIMGGFKYEVQHGLTRHETPRVGS